MTPRLSFFRSPLFRAQLFVGAVFATGTIGYRVLEGAAWWDAFFMTVITVTTVGYEQEVPLSRGGEIFTTVLLFGGLGVLLFVATEISRWVVEGELHEVLGRVRRSRMIERMSNHEIVCGYGRMGRAVVNELHRAARDVVVVDRHPDRVRELQESGIPVITGDATSEATLKSVSIQQAKGLVACLNDDAHNVYTVLTARTLNPELFIVARATEEGAERRILAAGADRVVNPYSLGGTRLAHFVVKPAIVNFFDASLDRTDLQLDQTSLSAGSGLLGRTLEDSDIRRNWGLDVVAVQRGGHVMANLTSELVFQVEDVLVLFGRRDQLDRFEADCGGQS